MPVRLFSAWRPRSAFRLCPGCGGCFPAFRRRIRPASCSCSASARRRWRVSAAAPSAEPVPRRWRNVALAAVFAAALFLDLGCGRARVVGFDRRAESRSRAGSGNLVHLSRPWPLYGWSPKLRARGGGRRSSPRCSCCARRSASTRRLPLPYCYPRTPGIGRACRRTRRRTYLQSWRGARAGRRHGAGLERRARARLHDAEALRGTRDGSQRRLRLLSIYGLRAPAAVATTTRVVGAFRDAGLGGRRAPRLEESLCR